MSNDEMPQTEADLDDKRLKPCPFCGGEAHVRIDTYRYYRRNGGYYCQVGCDKQDCRGFYFVDRFYKNPDDAIWNWNKRS